MEKLNNIVDECLRQHEGGEEFFDALDKEIQDTEIVTRLFGLVAEWILWKNYKSIGIMVSGKFGEWFKDVDLSTCNTEFKIVCVEGGLRHEVCGMKKHLDLSETVGKSGIKKWIFIDDSYYSGKTKEVIRRSLKSVGCKLLHTFVVYDGSPVKSKLVSSLYRYYE